VTCEKDPIFGLFDLQKPVFMIICEVEKISSISVIFKFEWGPLFTLEPIIPRRSVYKLNIKRFGIPKRNMALSPAPITG